jgi:hypothetical protein
MLIFDIETGPLPDEQLREQYVPLDESTIEGLVQGEFDPASVKCGNLKDPAKIQAKIDEARAAFEAAKANAPQIIAAAKEKHWQEFVASAALSPLTGSILVIGYHATEKGVTLIDEGNEPDLIVRFWTKYEECRAAGRKMVGHCIALFDVPFLVRRSWMNDIPVPSTVFDKGRWLDSTTLVDTNSLWQCGTRDSVQLGLLGRAFGVGGKLDGVEGADFARLYFGSPEEKSQAIAYSRRDVELTAQVAIRMGLA